ncbi:MAG: molecular chaperone DnaJ [Thermoleophilia bacterium]
MAATKRDYYEILGVTRTASEQELKKAFRQLARELHPDVSDDPQAEEKFREVAEAYEVLSKQETRDLYDRFGHGGLRRGGYAPPGDFGDLSDLLSSFFGGDLFGDVFGGGGRRARRRGADVAVRVEIDLAEAATGATREVVFGATTVCTTCNGSCAAPGSTPAVCDTCGGAGRVQTGQSSLLGQLVQTRPCPRCHGGGRIVTDPCEDCDGNGVVTEERRLSVDVPAGIADGQRIRIGGQGHWGGPGGQPGDLYVHVGVREDERFVRDGHDLVCRLDVSMAQAALGARVTVPTLDGDHELDLPAGTQPGEVILLRGKGMPALRARGRGDQHVVVNVRVPRRLTEEQRTHLAQLDATIDASAYDEAEPGFFERLRAAFR